MSHWWMLIKGKFEFHKKGKMNVVFQNCYQRTGSLEQSDQKASDILNNSPKQHK
jgi:hypothetical protein